MRKFLFVILIGLFSVSCESKTEEQLDKETRETFNSPKYIGTLPDGRQVKLVLRKRADFDHFIYFVDNSVSTNYTVQQGKFRRNETLVTIDGVKYVPAESIQIENHE